MAQAFGWRPAFFLAGVPGVTLSLSALHLPKTPIPQSREWIAVAPLVIGKLADRYGLFTALHIPIAAQLLGAAFFVLVIYFIRRNGLRHPALARHWNEESCRVLPQAIALGLESSHV